MLSVSLVGLCGPHLAFSIACQDGAQSTPRITHSGQVKTLPSASPPQQLGLPVGIGLSMLLPKLHAGN